MDAIRAAHHHITSRKLLVATLRAIALLLTISATPVLSQTQQFIGILHKSHRTPIDGSPCQDGYMLEMVEAEGRVTFHSLVPSPAATGAAAENLEQYLESSVAVDAVRLANDDLEYTTVSLLAQPIVHADLPPAIGEQSTLVVLVHFPDAQIAAAYGDREGLNRQIFGSYSNLKLNHLYGVGSSGRTWLSGKTVGPYVIPRNPPGESNGCNTNYWTQEGRARAQAEGVDVGSFRRFVLIFPHSVSCGWAGQAIVGAQSGSYAWIRFASERVLAHEYGHNLGFNHSLRASGGEDDTTMMVSSCQADAGPNGPHKQSVGWLPPDETLTVTASGNYSVQGLTFLAERESLPQVLRVFRGSGGDDFLYLSYRARNGEDLNMPSGTAEVVQVHYFQNGFPYLLSNLSVGQSYRDTISGAQVTYSSKTARTANLAISLPSSSNLTVTAAVTSAGAPVSDVSFRADSLGGTRTTNAIGQATFSGLKAGVSYRLTPRKTGFSFSPAFIDSTLSSSVTQQFVATPSSGVELRGRISLDGAPLAGVHIYSGSNNDRLITTNTNGEFSLGWYPSGTAFAVTPILASHRFSPETIRGVVSANTSPLNYQAALRRFRVTGRVSRQGAPGNQIAVNCYYWLGRNDIPAEFQFHRIETFTNEDGLYSCDDIPENADFSVAPRYDGGIGYTYSPSSAYLVVNENKLANFEINAALRNVSGVVVDQNNQPMANITVTSPLMGEAITGADGRFLYTNAPYGVTVTVTPRRVGWVFTPPTERFPVFDNTSWLRFVGRPNLCRADFDDSGLIGANDLSQYIALWMTNSGAADEDGTGTITPNDLLLFIARWMQGCG